MNEILKVKLEYLFTILDTNNNFILQPDDFTQVADKISTKLEYGMYSKARLELKLKSYRLFVQLLADIGKEDVSIDLDEWLSFFDHFKGKDSMYIKRYVKRVVNYLFTLFDQNNDNLIAKHEYEDMFKVYGLDEEYVEMGFSKLDTNGDHFISKDELIAGCTDFFTSTNPDAPGNWIFGNWKRDMVLQ